MKFFNQLLLHFSKLSFFFFGAFFILPVHAQIKLPRNAIQLIGGYSKHGSGDFNGIVFGTEYVKYVNHKFSLNYNIRGTINDGKVPLIVNDNITGTRTDASVRFTTAGVQLGVNGQYSLLKNARHELLLSLGGFGRYQSASNGSDGYILYGPQQTGQPTILIGYDNNTRQETFSLGGIFQFQYSFSFRNKTYIGILPGFQTDTNGDAIAQVALLIGRRF